MIKLKQLLMERRHTFTPLWHGTDDPPFSHFRAEGHSYLGIYGSSEKEYAKNFGKNLTRMTIEMDSPLVLDLDDKSSPHYSSPSNGEIVIDNQIIGFYRKLDRKVIDKIIQLGYDGIVVKYKGNPTFEVVSFDPKNVKILSWND